ncbi:hypothetical protein ACFFUT_17125 [Pseudohalocynthiibacter aestuariivivens]|uniref:Uncharacterized protein n=1 Tax=Pseudohalocynthiibacter aestuariivivens TaxID=1591409 RepID=A0ABV5JJ77_9RHOB
MNEMIIRVTDEVKTLGEKELDANNIQRLEVSLKEAAGLLGMAQLVKEVDI